MTDKAASLSPTTRLSPSQLHALLDILTHHETYDELERLKIPGNVATIGPPFVPQAQADDGAADTSSSSPLMASMQRALVLNLPAVRKLPAECWSVRCRGLMERLVEAELSESYDKGAAGTRKTLATVASAINESLVRGMLGGIVRDEKPRDLRGSYDATCAAHLVRAWEDVMHELVYGDLVDQLYDCAVKRESLEEHSPAAERVVDYIIVHLATFLHHVFVLSPEGPYLLKLLERGHSMTPWTVVRQTLRIGNAASMMTGLMNLMLAKVSIAALSNWIGVTQKADEGMNLMQRMISILLSIDSNEFRKSAEKIEKAKKGPSKEHLAAIREFIEKPRAVHEDARAYSMQHQVSIVAKILQDADPKLVDSLSPTQHTQCLEYLSALLSVRDREQITRVLCRQTPDLFTQASKEWLSALSPEIRAIHEHVDLSAHIGSIETFLDDMIRTSKPRTESSGFMKGVRKSLKHSESYRAPTVEDYVSLLRRNRQLLYNFLHQVAAKCPDLREEYLAYSKAALRLLRVDEKAEEVPSVVAQADSQASPIDQRRKNAAGRMSEDLQIIFSHLPDTARPPVLAALDAHARYLCDLEDLSLNRMQTVLDNLPADGPSSSTKSTPKTKSRASSRRPSRPSTPGSDGDQELTCGPGMFLTRWQDLLDVTPLTPAAVQGPVRFGRDVKGTVIHGKTGKGAWEPELLMKKATRDVPKAPAVDVVVTELRSGFKELLARRLAVIPVQLTDGGQDWEVIEGGEGGEGTT